MRNVGFGVVVYLRELTIVFRITSAKPTNH